MRAPLLCGAAIAAASTLTFAQGRTHELTLLPQNVTTLMAEGDRTGPTLVLR
jgi:hypothetical protein